MQRNLRVIFNNNKLYFKFNLFKGKECNWIFFSSSYFKAVTQFDKSNTFYYLHLKTTKKTKKMTFCKIN